MSTSKLKGERTMNGPAAFAHKAFCKLFCRDSHAAWTEAVLSDAKTVDWLGPISYQVWVVPLIFVATCWVNKCWQCQTFLFTRGDSGAGNTSLSLCIHPIRSEPCVFSICRDHKLRMWSCKSLECLLAADMMAHVPDTVDPYKVSVGGKVHTFVDGEPAFFVARFLRFNVVGPVGCLQVWVTWWRWQSAAPPSACIWECFFACQISVRYCENLHLATQRKQLKIKETNMTWDSPVICFNFTSVVCLWDGFWRWTPPASTPEYCLRAAGM